MNLQISSVHRQQLLIRVMRRNLTGLRLAQQRRLNDGLVNLSGLLTTIERRPTVFSFEVIIKSLFGNSHGRREKPGEDVTGGNQIKA
jgi:hypothetical protein